MSLVCNYLDDFNFVLQKKLKKKSEKILDDVDEEVCY